MKYIRIYTGDDGLTHFEDVEVATEPAGFSRTSALFPATGVIFRSSPGDHFNDWHPAPRRQFVIHLAGEVEVTVGDGETRRIGPGDVVMVEDTTGTGHITKGIGTGERLTLFVPLPD
jgi:uncharacterized cupin superfamily protein